MKNSNKYNKLLKVQLSIFRQWQMNPISTQYNLPGRYRFYTNYPYEHLCNAIIAIADSHPQLYTRYVLDKDGNPLQYIDYNSLNIELINLKETDLDEFDKVFVKPFDILNEPCVRFTVVKTELHTYLYQDVYHIAFDGTSLNIFKRELERTLLNKKATGERLNIDELLKYEAQSNTPLKQKEDILYFKDILSKSTISNFPESKPTPTKSNCTKNIEIENNSAHTFCQKYNVNINSLLLSTLSIVLCRLSCEKSALFGILHHGRKNHTYFNNIGMFVRTLPIIVELREQNIVDYIKDNQTTHDNLCRHNSLTIEDIISECTTTLPLTFAYQKVVNEDSDIAVIERLNVDSPPQLSIEIFDYEANFKLTFSYIKEQYESEFIEVLGKSFIACLHNIISLPQSNVADIAIITSHEQENLLALSYGGESEYQRDKTFIDYFLQRCNNTPNKLAITDIYGSLSYKDVDNYSNILAAQLIALGVTNNSIVAIQLPRIKEYIIAILAILKAGGAYLPLDIDAPKERSIGMLNECETNVLITSNKLEDFNIEQTIYIEDVNFDQKAVAVNQCNNNSLAYIIYTSGSTGNPKGVKIKHSSLIAYLNGWKNESFEIVESDRVSAYASFCFDASIDDIFGALFSGASLYIIHDSIRYDLENVYNFLNQHQISWCGFPTLFGVELINYKKLNIRTLFLGGDRLKRINLQKYNIVNGYGPTEFTVTSSTYTLTDKSDMDNIPIGRPIKNSWQYVLDKQLQLLPHGTMGELYLSGAQISDGYINNSALTSEKFIANPYATGDDNKMMYATGDIVRWKKDGDFEYIGRRDTQIKLRGYRIELSEIENCILKYKGISFCIVKLLDLGYTKTITAYYYSDRNIVLDELKNHLKLYLNSYMIPASFCRLKSIPTNKNGKLSAKNIITYTDEARKLTQPRNKTERIILKILCDILNSTEIGVDTNFFDYGLDSINAIHFTSTINKKLNQHITYSEIFQYGSVAELATHILKENYIENTGYDIADYNYQSIEDLLLKSNNRCCTPPRVILLTGATGFLGAHILKRLLQEKNTIIYCTVRGDNQTKVTERLNNILHYYFNTELDCHLNKRYYAVECDLTQYKDCNTLKIDNLDTVINCAANVNHYSHNMNIAKTNIAIADNLIEYCKLNDAKLIHISTNSIRGLKSTSCQTIPFDENTLFTNQKIDNQYIYSKFICERNILNAVLSGVDATIMRVGNLMVRSYDSKFQINDKDNAFIGILRAFIELQAFPIELKDRLVELSAVDYTADAIVTLTSVENLPYILHPYNSNLITFGEILEAISNKGKKIDLVDYNQFNERYYTAIKSKSRAEKLIALSNYMESDNGNMHEVTNDITNNILSTKRWNWQKIDSEYLNKLAITAIETKI